MTQQRLIGSSACGFDEPARRLKACSQISVMAYFTEPSWRVVLEPFEQRVAVTIGDRSYGDTDTGDEDMMDLYFRTPSTLHDLGVALIEASQQLEPIIARQPQEPASHEPAPDAPEPDDASAAADPVANGPVADGPVADGPQHRGA